MIETKKGRKVCAFILCAAIAIFMAGCMKIEKKSTSAMFLYYVNSTGTALEKEAYERQGETAENGVEEVLAELKKTPKSQEYKSAFPPNLSVLKWKLSEGRLDLYFDEAYRSMEKATEVFLRAAVVQTVVQIKGVEYVDFFIGSEESPLTDSAGNPQGYMRAEDFVKNTGSSLHSYQIAKLQLYFANKKGDKLGKEEVNLRYNSNMSIEKLIVEQLIKGPASQELQATIPPDTKVLGVSIKDGICYVNFEESFLNLTYSIEPKLMVYSIVNSIIDAGNASQVQISVNGEAPAKVRGDMDLSKPLSRDLDLMEEKD